MNSIQLLVPTLVFAIRFNAGDFDLSLFARPAILCDPHGALNKCQHVFISTLEA